MSVSFKRDRLCVLSSCKLWHATSKHPWRRAPIPYLGDMDCMNNQSIFATAGGHSKQAGLLMALQCVATHSAQTTAMSMALYVRVAGARPLGVCSMLGVTALMTSGHWFPFGLPEIHAHSGFKTQLRTLWWSVIDVGMYAANCSCGCGSKIGTQNGTLEKETRAKTKHPLVG